MNESNCLPEQNSAISIMGYNPSVYAHILSGVILAIGAIFSVAYFSKLTSDPYKVLVLILIFSLALGVHGISHMGLEYLYGYNPYSQKTIESWHPYNCPCRNKCPFFKMYKEIDQTVQTVKRDYH